MAHNKSVLSSNNNTLSKRKSYKQRYSVSGIRQTLSGQQNASSNKTFYTSFTDRIKYKMHLEVNDHLNLEWWQKLVGPTWSMFKVSPLSNVQYEEVQLKRYALCIKRELVNNIKDDTKDVQFDTKVSLMHDEEEQNDPSILQIEVTMSKNKNDMKLKYKGILFPVDVDNDCNLTFAPLLICIGAGNVTRIVHNTIQHLFDAVVRPLHISMEDLKWLSVLVCDMSMKGSANAKFEYELLNSNLKKLSISLSSSAIKSLWENVHNPDADEVIYEEVFDFYKYFHHQLNNIFAMRFDLLTLSRINFPNVTIACGGKLKIHTVETVAKVTSFIKQLALVLDTPTPSLSVPVSS